MEETMQKQNKPSYEELEKIVMQTQEKYAQLQGQFQNMEMTTLRLRLLLNVMNCPNITKFTNAFIEYCSKEIEEILTIKEQKDGKQSN